MVSATVSSVTTTFAYRGDGLRDSKTLGGNTTTFTWDIALSVVLDDGNQYVYGAGLMSMKQGGSWYYYLDDGLGSTMAIVDSTGASQKSYTYDVYGAVTGGSGSLANEFDFAGQQTDSTGLQYLRARYYDPETGSFLSRDPLASLIVWLGNPTSYVGGDPIGSSDPYGLVGIDSDGSTFHIEPNAPVEYGGEAGPLAPICHGTCWEAANPSSIGISLPDGSWLTQKSIDGILKDVYRICELNGEYGVACSGEAPGHVWRTIAERNSKAFQDAEDIFKFIASVYGTNKAAREAAEALGWKKAKVDWQGKAKNQDVFTDGKRFYSRDIDSHSGGAWKVFDAKGNRIGTVDSKGNFIGKR